MNLRPEVQERITVARAVLDAIERGGEIQWNCQSQANPKWIDTNTPNILDFLAFYRVKSPPRYYTVNELIKEGARYLCAGTEVYTIICLSAKSGELTIIISKLENHYPIWFHQHNFTWSADGREWKSFVKES